MSRGPVFSSGTRERGSICLYVAVILMTMGVVLAALIPLATNLRRRSGRREDDLQARLAFEAGIALVRSQELTFTSDLDVPVTVGLNGADAVVTPHDNASQLAKSILVTGTSTRNGKSYRFSRVVGYRLPSPFYFALLSDTKMDLSGTTITTGSNGADGDIYSGDEIKLSASSLVNGSALAKKAISVPGTITGRSRPNYADLPWVDVADANYLNEATSQALFGLGRVTPFSSTLDGLNLSATGTGDYPILYFGGNLVLKGTIVGRGTVFVKGDLTIDGDLRYGSPTDEAGIVVKGKITVAPAASMVEGTFYTAMTFTSNSPSLSMPRAIVVAKTLSQTKPLSIVRDNVARDDSDEAKRLRLPYYWP